MTITWLAHSSFLLTGSDGKTVLTDPYEPGGFGGSLRHRAYTKPVDIVTISHEHRDHNYTAGLAGSPIVVKGLELARAGGERQVEGVALRAIAAYHDARKGAERGENAVIAIRLNGVNVVHLGDLGHPLTAEQVAPLGPLDVLMTPVGGHFTLDAKAAWALVEALHPKIVLPMHVKTPDLDFPIAPVDEFVAGKPNVERAAGSQIEVTRETLPSATKIVVLEPLL
jgi:L-ascorbate metabolism protein UlaG (beta-lactamase superfamily)